MDTVPSMWLELMQTDFNIRHVDVNGVSTRVMESGEGPPLVVSNGTSGHLECYVRTIKKLAPYFRVYCYDAIGHGYTDGPDEPYTLPVYSNHLLGLIDVLGLERPHLSGESLGAWVSAWFSANNPDRVDRLVLNTPGNITMKTEFMEMVSESTRKAVANPSRETVRPRLEWLFAPENRWMVSDELVDARVAIYGQPGYEKTIENVLVLQDPEIRKNYTWTEEWCSKIEAQTLIVWTSQDPSGKPTEGRLLEEWIPNSSYMMVEEAGHWLQWEKPDDFLRIHREFLLDEKP